MSYDLNLKRRIALLKDRMNAGNIDAMLISYGKNVAYLSAFRGHDSLLFITKKNNYFITDSRYIEEANNEVKGFRKILIKRSSAEVLFDIIRKECLGNVGFEAAHLSYAVASRLIKIDKKIKFLPCLDFVERIREIKDPDEIRLIKRAARITKDVFEFVKRQIKAGITESYIHGLIRTEFFARNADTSFDSIVASGERSSMPHARPGAFKIRRNSFLMMDLGARLDGYCADMTRMISVGRADKKYLHIYKIVEGAKNAAIARIRPGVKACDIDIAARKYIADAGYGKYFSHSVGHGVGLDIHERPGICYNNNDLLREGMIFTVEPAIYIPKFGGVRIEDLILVKKDGYEILTS